MAIASDTSDRMRADQEQIRASCARQRLRAAEMRRTAAELRAQSSRLRVDLSSVRIVLRDNPSAVALSPPVFTFEPDVHPRSRVLGRFSRLDERFVAPRADRRQTSSIIVEPRVKLVGSGLAVVRDPLALVGSALAPVVPSVSLVRVTVSLIKLAAPLLQSRGLRTGASSSVTGPLGDSTLLGGLIASSPLLPSLSVLRRQTSAALEHVGRAHKDLEQAPRVRRWTH